MGVTVEGASFSSDLVFESESERRRIFSLIITSKRRPCIISILVEFMNR